MNFQKPIQIPPDWQHKSQKKKNQWFFYIILGASFTTIWGKKHQENFCCKFLSYKKILTFRPLTFKAGVNRCKKSWSYNKVAYHGVLQKKVMTKLSDLLGHMDERLYKYCTHIITKKYTHVFMLFTNFVTYIQDLFGFRPKGPRVKMGF